MNLLRLQLQEENRGPIFFGAIRLGRKNEAYKKKLELKWGAPDYKIYPSSLKSWTTCPVEFMKSLENPTTIEDITAIYRVKRGSSVHKEFQTDALISDILYDKPIAELSARIFKKLKDGYPEIPFHDLKTGVSGSIDAVIRLKDLPTPVEIKSTSKAPEEWEDYCEKKLPLDTHLLQLLSYIYHINKNNYYPKQAERGILAYVNLLMSPGDLKAEKEYIIQYSDYKEKFEVFMFHLTKARDNYIQGKVEPCDSPLCRKHKNGK